MSETNELLARELRALRNRVVALESLEAPRRGSGTAFPTGVSAGYEWFRTDLGMECYYDGTRWLTKGVFFVPIQALATFTTTSPQDSAIVRLRTDYAPYIVRVSVQAKVNTTNNGTNFWTVDVNGIDTAGASSSSIYSFTTAGDTLATRTAHEAAATSPTPANAAMVRVTITKTLAPGTIELAASLYHRLIIP